MTAQQRTFTSRVNRRIEKEQKQAEPGIYIPIGTVDDDTDEETFMEGYTFHRPSEGRLFLMATAFGASARPENAASEVDATIREMLVVKREERDPETGDLIREWEDDADYRKLRARIDGPVDRRVDLEVLIEIIGVLTEEFGEGFPTQPSTGSSAAPQRTGGKSTGRSPGRASTSTR